MRVDRIHGVRAVEVDDPQPWYRGDQQRRLSLRRSLRRRRLVAGCERAAQTMRAAGTGAGCGGEATTELHPAHVKPSRRREVVLDSAAAGCTRAHGPV